MFEKITQFFTETFSGLWNFIKGLFRFGDAKTPPRADAFAVAGAVRNTESESAGVSAPGKNAPAPAPKREMSEKERMEAFNRIKINTYNQADIAAFDAYYKAHGLQANDKMNQAQEAFRNGIGAAYGAPYDERHDRTYVRDRRRNTAQTVVDKFEAQKETIGQEQMQIKAVDTREFVRLSNAARMAGVSEKDAYKNLPQIAFSEDLKVISVSVPKNANGAHLDISKMPGSDYYSVAIMPKNGDFTPVHADNLTLDDVKRMVVIPPTKGTLTVTGIELPKGVSVNVDALSHEKVSYSGIAVNGKEAPRAKLVPVDPVELARREAVRLQHQKEYNERWKNGVFQIKGGGEREPGFPTSRPGGEGSIPVFPYGLPGHSRLHSNAGGVDVKDGTTVAANVPKHLSGNGQKTL